MHNGDMNNFLGREKETIDSLELCHEYEASICQHNGLAVYDVFQVTSMTAW